MKNLKFLRKINKTFVRQHSRFYCGLACLASVTRYYGGSTTQEKLQSKSGTTLNGTSMLGLYQAARNLGFDAGGYEATTENLKEIDKPVILHTLTSEAWEHYVVCYGYQNGKFIIGDPAQGIMQMTEPELTVLWRSGTLLQLTPGKDFKSLNEERSKKLDWFLQLVRPDMPVLGLAAIMGVFISVLSLATAIFTQKLIDQFIPDRNMGLLVPGLIILCLVLIARAMVIYVRTAMLVRQGKDMNIRLASGFFGKLVYLPKPFFDSTSTGDMVARLNDAQRIQRVVVNLSSQVAIDLLVSITSLVYIFFLSPSAGIISLLAIPLFGVIAWLYNQRIVQSQQEVLQTYAATESKFIDTLQGIKTIKSFNGENLFSKMVQKVYSFYMQSAWKLGQISAKLSFCMNLGSSLWLSFVISWVTWQVMDGQLLLGQMMAIITIAGTLGTSIMGMAMAHLQFHEARIAFDRMFEFSSASPEYPDDTEVETHPYDTDPGFRLLVRNLSFRFPGKRVLLKKVNLNISKGHILAVFGAVGCGKSTLFDILTRFHPIEEGVITVNDVDWNLLHTKVWRENVALVPQHVSLFNATILENIAMHEMPDPKKILAFCQEFGFHEFIMELQQGYVTLVNENCSNLSGGQRQLIALARALYKNPKLLLLDEATAAMDHRTEKFVVELLNTLKERMAIVIVTHRAPLAGMADSICVIENHTVSILGNPEYVFQNNRLFKESFPEIPEFLLK